MNFHNEIAKVGNEIKYKCPYCEHGALWKNSISGKWHCFYCGKKGVSSTPHKNPFQGVKNPKAAISPVADTLELPRGYSRILDPLAFPVGWQYLISRGVNPASVEWGTVDKRQVTFPCRENGKLVFWQSRNLYPIPNQQKTHNPYYSKAGTVYNIDAITEDRISFLTEGVFDALTIGGQALLGANWNDAQIQTIVNKFPLFVFVILDNDAKSQAVKLSQAIKKQGLPCSIVPLPVNLDPNKVGFSRMFDLIYTAIEKDALLTSYVAKKTILKLLELKYSKELQNQLVCNPGILLQ